MTFDQWMNQHMSEGNRGLSYSPPAREVWEAATKAERERCAKACAPIGSPDDFEPGIYEALAERAKSILAG